MKKVTRLLFLLFVTALASDTDSPTPHMRRALRRERDALLGNFAELHSELELELGYEGNDHGVHYEEIDASGMVRPLPFFSSSSSSSSSQANAAKDEDLSVGLVVPCLQKNIDRCELHRMLDSVADQTELPNTVLIVPSGMSEADGAKLEKDLQQLYATTPLKDTTLKVKAIPNQVFAGESRNRGITELNTHIVIAMDADDEMAPIKVAVTKSVMRETGARCLLHPFAWPKDRRLAFETRDAGIWRSSAHADGTELYKMCTVLKQNNGTIKHEPGGLGWQNKQGREVAQGHLTCLREVFDEIHYDNSREKGEDSLFLRDILTHYGPNDAKSLHVVDLILTVYHPGNSPRNAWMHDGKHLERYFNKSDPDDALRGWISASSLVAKPSEGTVVSSGSSGCVRDKTYVADRV